LQYKAEKLGGYVTLCLKAARSSKVKASDLAMTGTTLTTSESFFKTTISMGFKLNQKLLSILFPIV
jgi:hypothetical protein